MHELMLAMLQIPDFSWAQAAYQVPTVLVLVVILGAVIRVAPTWKEVKLRELEIRAAEGTVREKEAASLAILAEALNGVSETLNKVSIEQKKATDEIQIMQRVNADSNDRLAADVRSLSDRLGRYEASQSPEIASASMQ